MFLLFNFYDGILGIAYGIFVGVSKFYHWISTEIVGNDSLFTNPIVLKAINVVYTVAAIFMLFRIVVSLLSYLVDPDKSQDKNAGGGKLALRIIIVVVLMLLTMPLNGYSAPGLLFGEINDLQNTLIEGKVVDRFFSKIQQSSDTKKIDATNLTYNTQYDNVYADTEYLKSIISLKREDSSVVSEEDEIIGKRTYSGYSMNSYDTQHDPLYCATGFKGTTYGRYETINGKTTASYITSNFFNCPDDENTKTEILELLDDVAAAIDKNDLSKYPIDKPENIKDKECDSDDEYNCYRYTVKTLTHKKGKTNGTLDLVDDGSINGVRIYMFVKEKQKEKCTNKSGCYIGRAEIVVTKVKHATTAELQKRFTCYYGALSYKYPDETNSVKAISTIFPVQFYKEDKEWKMTWPYSDESKVMDPDDPMSFIIYQDSSGGATRKYIGVAGGDPGFFHVDGSNYSISKKSKTDYLEQGLCPLTIKNVYCDIKQSSKGWYYPSCELTEKKAEVTEKCAGEKENALVLPYKTTETGDISYDFTKGNTQTGDAAINDAYNWWANGGATDNAGCQYVPENDGHGHPKNGGLISNGEGNSIHSTIALRDDEDSLIIVCPDGTEIKGEGTCKTDPGTVDPSTPTTIDPEPTPTDPLEECKQNIATKMRENNTTYTEELINCMNEYVGSNITTNVYDPFSGTLFFAFITDNDGILAGEDITPENVLVLDSALETLKRYDPDDIDVSSFLAIIIGLVTLGFLAVLAIDVVVRNSKLIFLEMISPIAILAYLNPNDKIFMQWVKQFVATFIDLFLKLIAIHAIALLIKVFKVGNDITGIGAIFFILGILTFAKVLPDFISKIFGIQDAAGTMKDSFNMLKRAAFVGAGVAGAGLAMGAAGISGGIAFNAGRKQGATGVARFGNGLLSAAQGLGGILGAGLTGLGSGYKGKVMGGASASWQKNMKKANAYKSGASPTSLLAASTIGAVGMDYASRTDKKNQDMVDQNESLKELLATKGEVEKIANESKVMQAYDAAVANGTIQEKVGQREALRDAYVKQQMAMRTGGSFNDDEFKSDIAKAIYGNDTDTDKFLVDTMLSSSFGSDWATNSVGKADNSMASKIETQLSFAESRRRGSRSIQNATDGTSSIGNLDLTNYDNFKTATKIAGTQKAANDRKIAETTYGNERYRKSAAARDARNGKSDK